MLLPGYEFTKGRGVDKIVDKKTKIRADGTEKSVKASMMVFMHFLMLVLIGRMLYQSIKKLHLHKTK